MAKRQVTLSDIAKELNISTATVSRALKDYPDISKETKEKVLALVKAWKYRPNSLAAGLRKQESRIIGVIVPEIVNHFFSGVIKGIMKVAYDHGYRVMICQSGESKEKEIADANALFENRVDGLLVSLAHETDEFDHLNQFRDAGIPLVQFDKVSDHIDSSKITVDDYKGAKGIVEHLIKQGARKIAHFAGPMIASTSSNRFLGYRDALEEHGIPFNPDWVRYCQQIDLETGEQFADELLQLSDPPDAIFAITDSVALGALISARKHNIQVPQDLLVAGFSDWVAARIFQPSLTTVSQPSFELGTKATEVLLEEIKLQQKEAEITQQDYVLPTRLVVRASTA